MYNRYLHTFYNFFFNDTATTEIYTLSLHDALPISQLRGRQVELEELGVGRRLQPHRAGDVDDAEDVADGAAPDQPRSEEHTSELQSRQYLVCRLLLEKKKTIPPKHHHPSSPLTIQH